MWDERYASKEYVYGEKPNEFIAEELRKLKPGKALFPAEGEGRNAVYAATLGWEVTAFDPSVEGKKKAELLADKNNVSIDYQIAGYETFNYPEEAFDLVVLSFAHMPSSLRISTHKKLAASLKPEGKLILQGFSKEQLGRDSGGPQNLEFLFSKEELEADFKSSMESLEITEYETILHEGAYHQGEAAVISLVGTKFEDFGCV